MPRRSHRGGRQGYRLLLLWEVSPATTQQIHFLCSSIQTSCIAYTKEKVVNDKKEDKKAAVKGKKGVKGETKQEDAKEETTLRME
ncbi:uncharacterized protein LOC121295758 isoform X1 [Polyodon spathula]|uniref:uncharacterized protein LOC121295758 isoform X1 n=1 Tax=Polyodon spathula TaxID=7913 RepID=UPI001B7F2C07|nr:uncharacterized protein LOC121295758 isoform X1 [Polyodon spathula]